MWRKNFVTINITSKHLKGLGSAVCALKFRKPCIISMHISWTLYSFQIQVSTLSLWHGHSMMENHNIIMQISTHEGSRHPSDPTHYGWWKGFWSSTEMVRVVLLIQSECFARVGNNDVTPTPAMVMQRLEIHPYHPYPYTRLSWWPRNTARDGHCVKMKEETYN